MKQNNKQFNISKSIFSSQRIIALTTLSVGVS